MSAPRRVLLIAYHFPPLAGSSGIQRTLRFVQHLPAFGWEPLVLSVHPWAYERTSPDLLPEVPAGTVVRRAFCLDTARHLALAGRHLAGLARPDRWVSWRFDGVRQGLDLVRRFRPGVIWSTYPIATAHLIGAELQRRTALPWVADFRDPMAQDGYPADPLTWKQFERIERNALAKAGLSTFTTPSAVGEYRQRYPDAAPRIRLLENGYDEESFTALPGGGVAAPLTPGALTLLHSGIVYPSERDPRALLRGLRLLHETGVVSPHRLRIRFRAPVSGQLVQAMAHDAGVLPYIEILPAVPYREALAEMTRADGLLVLQASNCNAQIPAKLYEYLRAGRPVLCLTDPVGDTALTLRQFGVEALARLDDAEDIARLLRRFVEAAGACPELLPQPGPVTLASRRGRTEVLAGWLDELAESRQLAA